MKVPDLNAIRIRAVIDDVVTSYSDRIHSHKSSWPRMQRCMVQDYFDASGGGRAELLHASTSAATAFADTWLVSHSMEFNGEAYNLFGGWTEALADRIDRFVGFEGKTYSLERKMPDIQALLAGRDRDRLCPPDWWDKLGVKCRMTPTLMHREILEWTKPIDHVVLGDSHSVAHYQRGALVSRTDGLTLHRLLETGLYTSLMRVYDRPVKKLTICAGNIDIRHHLLRQGDPFDAVNRLVEELDRQIRQLIDEYRWIEDFEVITPLFVEHEGRKIPKTGWHKGAPFYGSRKERSRWRALMWCEMICTFGNDHVWSWPQKWMDEGPEAYAENYMEKPGSVHLSPAWHRWNYESNMPNEALAKEYE